jgi:hypothetical protein
MSVSKRFLTEENISAVLKAYQEPGEKPTLEALAKRFNTTYHNVQFIAKTYLSPEEYRLEKGLRSSRAKMGEKHPHYGKHGSLHPNWKGDVSDNKGRTTRKVGDKRYFTARVVFAEALGVHPKDLPLTLQVHHIDENPLNNDINNLALVTSTAHGKLHGLEAGYRKSPMWVKWLSGISKSKEITPIVRKAS